MRSAWMAPVLSDYAKRVTVPCAGGARKTMRRAGDPRPLISIVTVVRNAEREFEKTIRSVLAQDYELIEFIVVDGDSRDRTVEVVRQHDRSINRWVSAPDRGIADAMNLGVAIATGDIVNFLNAGDYYTESSVVRDVAEWYMSDQWTWAYGLARLMVDFKETGFRQRYRPYKLWHSFYYTPMCHQATFYKRSLFEEIGMHKVGNDRLFDIDFVLRASRHVLPAGTPKYFVWYDVTGYSSKLRFKTASERIAVVAESGKPRLMVIWSAMIYYRLLRSYAASLFKAGYRRFMAGGVPPAA
jgi:glycosyltransferase involved in cell wall biosynthesis